MVKRGTTQDVIKEIPVVLSRHFVPITFPFFFFSVELFLLDWARSGLSQLPFHAADNRQLKLVSRPIPRLLLRFLGKLGVELNWF